MVYCDVAAPARDLFPPPETKRLEDIANVVVDGDFPFGANPFGLNENKRALPKPKAIQNPIKVVPTTKSLPKIVPTLKSLPKVAPTLKPLPKIIPTTKLPLTTKLLPQAVPAIQTVPKLIPSAKAPLQPVPRINVQRTAPILLQRTSDFARIPVTTTRKTTTSAPPTLPPLKLKSAPLPAFNFRSSIGTALPAPTAKSVPLPPINFRSRFEPTLPLTKPKAAPHPAISFRSSVQPISENVHARVLQQKQVIHPDGTYEYSFETDNGISVEERGHPKSIGANENAEQVSGSYSFVENGQTYSVQYVANENGFQPTVRFEFSIV